MARAPKYLVLVFAAGCSGAAVERQQAIIGGTIDHGDPAVVKIQFVGRDGRYIESGVCSGSLIAPNVVLTAGHCVAPVLSQNWRTPSFYSERVDVNLGFLQRFIDNAAAPAPACATESGGCAGGGGADPRALLFVGLFLVALAERKNA